MSISSVNSEAILFSQDDYYEVAVTEPNPFSEPCDNPSKLLLPKTRVFCIESRSEDLSTHLTIARKTVQYVQSVVLHSDNFPMRSKQPMPVEVRAQISELRKQIVPLENTQDGFNKTVELIKQYQVGNCQEMATLGCSFIDHCYRTSVHLRFIQNGDHVFIQIGEKDSVFCDPWNSSYYPSGMILRHLMNYEGVITIDGLTYPVVRNINPTIHTIEGFFAIEVPTTPLSIQNTLFCIARSALEEGDLRTSTQYATRLLGKTEHLQPQDFFYPKVALLCLQLGLVLDSRNPGCATATDWYGFASQRGNSTGSRFLSHTYTKICERAPSQGIQPTSSPFYKSALWHSRFAGSQGDLRSAHRFATLISMDPQASEENQKLEVLALRQIVGSSQGRTQDDMDAWSIQDLHRKATRKIEITCL